MAAVNKAVGGEPVAKQPSPGLSAHRHKRIEKTLSHTTEELEESQAPRESQVTQDPARAEDSRAKLKAGQAALKKLLAPVQPIIYCAQFLALISSVLAVAPYVALVALGSALFDGDTDRIRTIAQWVITAFLGQLFLYFLALLITHLADVKLVGINRRRIVAARSQAPLSWFGQTNSGRVRKAVEDDTLTLHTLTAHAPVEQVAAIVTPLSLVAYAFILDWRLGLLAIATVPIYLAIQAYSMKDMGTKTAEMDNYLGKVSATAVEFAEGISVVKAFGTVGKAHGRYRDAAARFADFYYEWVKPLLRVSALSESVIAVPVLLLINVGAGSLLVAAGTVTVAEVIATTLIALVIPGTIQTIGMMMWSYQLAGNAALRLDEVMNLTPVVEGTRELDPRNRDVTVAFHDVSFSYDANSPVLRNFTAILRPGTVTALIGPSGSGKSTAATMLARFQDPDSGHITIDGVDIRELSFASLYRTVAFVLQDPHLVRMSIRDNIRLNRPDASDDEVWAAADAARIADDIRALPAGLDTVVGEGTSLSGGQQQRISIARAIVADTPILILDEATAATDPDSEAEIQAALTRLVAGKTVLVIAHKPESIKGADQVIELEPMSTGAASAGAQSSCAPTSGTSSSSAPNPRAPKESTNV
ncbi:ABC transporter ATP-binding protein [Corynebacterium sp. 320]|nr:ABC transporter ATP-binding protein [Corynebacterium sp. 320]KAB1553384.1 ABC transporter ATP-binding protein [Corynebacterium sp. 321]KAB1554505.1 ABC transporter ATP-binding protein [Corynebacterium sp. 319]KAB3528691.1 ABC transporter ATP-binding protein [Corynebacterium sp. 250]KAB3540872.1 ABC transporter ATP-binding protein [Corynebacterium sp. 366]QNP93256.1 ABC transporter ATP-binding protein [Corynebacterium zhongnanshanii]